MNAYYDLNSWGYSSDIKSFESLATDSVSEKDVQDIVEKSLGTIELSGSNNNLTLYVNGNSVGTVTVEDKYLDNVTYSEETGELVFSIAEGNELRAKIDLTDYTTTSTVQQMIDTKYQTLDDYVNSRFNAIEGIWSNYATTESLSELQAYVNSSLEGISAQYVAKYELENYVTKDQIPSLDGYATERWVEEKGYLTEHQDLDNVLTKIEQTNTLVTELNDEISSLQNEIKQMKQTPAEIKADIEKGGDFNLTTNLTVEDSIKLTKPTNLDLGNNSIVNKTAGKDAFMFAGGDFTIANGVIDNTVGGGATAGCYLNSSKGTNLTLDDVKVTATYPVYLNNATMQPTCLIKSGEFVSPNDNGVAVYVEKGGKVTIEGGYFTTDGHESKYLLNLKDALCPADGSVDPRDYIVVKGGTFVNFNPMASDGEPLKPANFVADGYTVQENKVDENTTEYTVVKEK